MRVLIATDAWRPQVNGVVRTYERLAEEVVKLGTELAFLTPNEFRTLPCPTYPEIRLALPDYAYAVERLKVINPDAVHIATEGPVGWMTRAYCLSRKIPFTTSFHTRFPEYLASRFRLSARFTYALLRRFHSAGAGMMVASRSLSSELESRGFRRMLPWSRGVNTDLFRPRTVRLFGKEPVFLYVGRVAVEKNLEAFLNLKLPGRKVVVGSGPQLADLQARFPHVLFTGKRLGEELAQCYASGDVFVFPSRTDTFGIVLLEAMAAGLPVAAFPVTGPIDLIVPDQTGVLSEDLGTAALAAMDLDRTKVRARALEFSWENTARNFLANIETALSAARDASSRPATSDEDDAEREGLGTEESSR